MHGLTSWKVRRRLPRLQGGAARWRTIREVKSQSFDFVDTLPSIPAEQIRCTATTIRIAPTARSVREPTIDADVCYPCNLFTAAGQHLQGAFLKSGFTERAVFLPDARRPGWAHCRSAIGAVSSRSGSERSMPGWTVRCAARRSGHIVQIVLSWRWRAALLAHRLARPAAAVGPLSAFGFKACCCSLPSTASTTSFRCHTVLFQPRIVERHS